MSSTIKLYEHNQKAYDALLDMLGERDRACVIKPTGTGKFVIIAKMVQDNPDKRFLLLGTNDYMFNDQMANLAEIAPGFTPENLQFMTYAAAMGMERRNDCVPPYDVIIADEFHHCGAEEWGKGVTSWWMPPTTSDTSGRAGRTVRLPTCSRRLPCSDGSNNGS